MVFCNSLMADVLDYSLESHNPYFNRWFSAISITKMLQDNLNKVTILILIDGFLQYCLKVAYSYTHNKSQSLF